MADLRRLAIVDVHVSSHRLEAHVTIERTPDARWSLHLATELDGSSGERTFSGNTCGAVVDASVLTLALILNPTGEEAPLPPSNAAASKQPRPPSPSPPPVGFVVSDGEDPKAQTESRRLKWMAAGQLGLQAGVLKHPGPVFAIGLGAARGQGSAWLVASYVPPQDVAVDRQPAVGARLWLASGAAFGCWTAVTKPASADGCFGFEIDRLDGRGFGVTDARHGVMYWTSAAPALAVGIPISRFVTAKLSGIGLVPVNRPSAFLENIGVVHRPANFAGKILVGAEFSIP